MSRMIGLARLGRDSELRYTPDGQPVTNLSLAFSWGKRGDDGKRSTTWVDAALWGKLAEAISPYLLKGGRVFVIVDDVHIDHYKKGDGTPAVKLAGRVTAIEPRGPPQHDRACNAHRSPQAATAEHHHGPPSRHSDR